MKDFSTDVLCFIGWHDFTKWEYEGEVTISSVDRKTLVETPQKKYEIQKRECVHCGIKKMRRERR